MTTLSLPYMNISSEEEDLAFYIGHFNEDIRRLGK
jgi:hypothetical protein